jgi:aryl-alcohol dehydrogenase-like predicted oxidoreductase
MEYRNLGRAGVKVSRLCLGTMMFGGPTNERDSIEIIHRAMDDGINFIDTANVYNDGESERILGKAVSDRRDRAVIATKVFGPRGDGPNDGGNSRIHIFILHRRDYETPLEESIEALNDLVRQGKVRYAGCSNFYGYELAKSLWISDRTGHVPMSVVQPLYNIVNRNPEQELFPCCREHGVGVMVYSPLARGVLAGKYLPGQPPPEGSRADRKDVRMMVTETREESYQVAQQLKPLADAHGKSMTQFSLNWVMANPIVTSAIVGPRTMDHYEDNLGCLGWEISEDALDKIDELVPPGEHTGWGFNDPMYPILGRPRT